MKLAATLIGLLLLVIGIVHSVPVTENNGGEMSVGAEETPVVTEDMPGNTEENTGVEVDEGDIKPSEHYLEEVREYFRQHVSEDSLSRVARQVYGSAISHGDTVALQTWVRLQWISCAGSRCGPSTCPNLYITGSDWDSCFGNVFRIYRASGPGAVRVGDLVGLYYPHEEGRWMGCPTSNCGKTTCPGYPTTAYGFASLDHWYRCWGEVFRIYARGKQEGATITSSDDIALYYLQDDLWVSQGSGLGLGLGATDYTGKSPCLGTSRPPALPRYDVCPDENLKIWKKH